MILGMNMGYPQVVAVSMLDSLSFFDLSAFSTPQAGDGKVRPGRGTTEMVYPPWEWLMDVDGMNPTATVRVTSFDVFRCPGRG